MMAAYVHILTFEFQFDDGRIRKGEIRIQSDEFDLSLGELERTREYIWKYIDSKLGKVSVQPVLVNSIRVLNIE